MRDVGCGMWDVVYGRPILILILMHQYQLLPLPISYFVAVVGSRDVLYIHVYNHDDRSPNTEHQNSEHRKTKNEKRK